jgi:hypothetical protein
MYHTHEASLYSDKVYALLGMSSDDFRTAGLAPDYNVPWKDLFQALTRYVLCEEISVEVSSGGDSAIIESEGCILGKISFANVEATWNGRQHVGVTWRSTQGTATMTGSRSSHWDLQPSAKQIAIGDAICLFQGTSKPTVIRFCVDHWAVILIAATPPRIVQAGSEDVEWSRYLQNVKSLRTRSFRCLWNWINLSENFSSQEENKASHGCWSQVMRVWKSALLLEDLEEHESAARKFQEGMVCYEITSEKECIVDCPVGVSSVISDADLDFMNKIYGQPPLLWAAERGYEAVIEFLVTKLNADIDFKDRTGRTAIQLAATKGNLAVVERLLQKKAEVNAAATKHNGRTLLQTAAEGGHFAIVERLLQEKADVNAVAAEYDGRTALQAAAGEGHLAIVERLLQEQADVDAAAAAKDGRTALQAAAERGYLAVVERLLQEKADVNGAAAENGGRTALQAAAEGGSSCDCRATAAREIRGQCCCCRIPRQNSTAGSGTRRSSCSCRATAAGKSKG